MNTSIAKAALFGGALLSAGISGGQLASISDQIEALDTPDYSFGYGSYGTSYFQYSPDPGYGYGYGYVNYGSSSIEVDLWNITVTGAGDFQFDVLSWDSFDTYLDTYIRLYEDDGQPLSSSNLVDSSDDAFGDMNGSVSSLDSFLDVFLSEGDYILAIGSYFLTDIEADEGFSDGRLEGALNANGDVLSGQYRIDIFGNGALTVVPTPATAALIGLAGLTTARRRR